MSSRWSRAMVLGFVGLAVLTTACGRRSKGKSEPSAVGAPKSTAATATAPTAQARSTGPAEVTGGARTVVASAPLDEDDDGDDDGVATGSALGAAHNQLKNNAFVAAVKPPSAAAASREEQTALQGLLKEELPVGAELPAKVPAAAPPVVVKKDRGTCGEITVGAQTYKLDCMHEGYDDIKTASSPVVSAEDLIGGPSPGAAAKLPDAVDFRATKSVGPVLDQGPTLACTAFSLATVLDHEAASLRRGAPAHESPMHIWARYANPSMQEAIQTNAGKGVTTFDTFPFDARVANAWDQGRPPAAAFLAKADAASDVRIVDVTKLAPKEVQGALAAGHAVWFALAAAHNITKTVGKGDAQVIPPYDYRTVPADKQMGHAIALVGYRKAKDGKLYYLIQNSWGKGWGANGFAFIDEDTFAKNTRYAYVVHVEPARGAPKAGPATSAVAMGAPVGGLEGAAPPAKEAALTKCKRGLLPDSATGQCVPKCPDGAARHGGACADASDCPAGQINVAGRCVVAAPKGTVARDGYGARCVGSGCIYTMKKGVAGCTRERGCVVTCAAPRWRLVQGPRGARCN